MILASVDRDEGIYSIPVNDEVVIRDQPWSYAQDEARKWKRPLFRCTGMNLFFFNNSMIGTCCYASICPLMVMSKTAEKSESNIFGKFNRSENFKCAGIFAYFCCFPELLCFLTLLLREEIKGEKKMIVSWKNSGTFDHSYPLTSFYSLNKFQL